LASSPRDAEELQRVLHLVARHLARPGELFDAQVVALQQPSLELDDPGVLVEEPAAVLLEDGDRLRQAARRERLVDACDEPLGAHGG
jgi:hypothetical protein